MKPVKFVLNEAPHEGGYAPKLTRKVDFQKRLNKQVFNTIHFKLNY